MTCDNDDVWYKPYEREGGVGRWMQDYLSWEVGLVEQIDRGAGFVELRALWQDDVPVDDGGQSLSPSYFLAEVRVGLDELSVGRIDIAPFLGVANLFDATYNASVVPNARGNRYFEPGPGRTYRVGLGVTWR